jgi:hypothetical protein
MRENISGVIGSVSHDMHTFILLLTKYSQEKHGNKQWQVGAESTWMDKM